VAAEYITNVYDDTADLLNNGSTSGDKINQINKNSSLLILLLNFAEDIDSAIIQIIYNIYGNIRNSQFEEAQTQIAYFKAHIQIYLKLEWNRVKSEVKTGIYDENQRCKETLELYDKFLHARKFDKVKIKDVYEMLKEKYSHVL
jgi:predicted DNA-binding protein YlxM (UPF0122 family)